MAGALIASMSMAAAARPLRDPLLKLTYASSSTRLQPAPADLARRCPALLGPNYGHRMWLFAGLGDAGLMIVAGLFTANRPGLSDVVDDHGTMLRLTAGGCTMIGAAVDAFRDPAGYADTVSPADLALLARGAADRYAAAFGRKRVCAALRARHASKDRLPPDLSAAFAHRLRCAVR